MHMSPGAPCEKDIADDHDFFSFVRHAFEAEARADDALVHGPALRERRLLTVIGDGDAEAARVLERRAHEVRAGNRFAIVADRDGAGADHLAEFGEGLTALAERDGADWIDSRRA